ncbi:MAG TPA: cation diffusion facilitator family transporter [Solirubrobacteraceae bacterium]|jgi:cobalt-zinc-cadmium efflux system protein|nr:cation diffusion facilitator family transporter [Solirubrobacteraceae bacterium]
MAHAHHGHSHSHALSADSDARRLWVALALILAFMVGEVVTAVFAHSLVLLSDAGHMLTDALAIGVSLLALQLMRRPAQGAMTYGLGRVEALSAQFNGAMLLVLAVLITYEAVRHLIAPPDTRGLPVLVVALVGILVNLLASGQLARANRASMNVEGSFQHLLTDLFAFIGTAVAALVILTTGFLRADAIASLLVAALMVRSASGLLRDSGRVFLEAAPHDLDPRSIGLAMAGVPGVVEVHDLHVWQVSSGFPALSAHVLVSAQSDCHVTRRQLQAMLRERFAIEHSTLQVDHEGGDLLSIELSPQLRRG